MFFLERIVILLVSYLLCLLALPYYKWNLIKEVIPISTSPFKDVSQNSQGSLQMSVTNNQTWIYSAEFGWLLYNISTLLGQNSVSLSYNASNFAIGASDGWLEYSNASKSSEGIFSPGTLTSTNIANTNSVSISADGQVLVLGTKFDGVWIKMTLNSVPERIIRSSVVIGDTFGQISSVKASSNLISSNIFAIGNPSSSAFMTTSMTNIFNSIFPIGSLDAMSTSYSVSYHQNIHLLTTENGLEVSTNSGQTWSTPLEFQGLSVTDGDLSLTDGRFMAVIVGKVLYLSSDFGQTWIENQTFSSTLTSLSLSSDGSSLTILEGSCINQGTCNYVEMIFSCSFIKYCNPTTLTYLQYLKLDSLTFLPIAQTEFTSYISNTNNWLVQMIDDSENIGFGPLSASSFDNFYRLTIVNGVAYSSTNAGFSWVPVLEIENCLGAAMLSDGSIAYLFNGTMIWSGSIFDSIPSEMPSTITKLPSWTYTSTSTSTYSQTSTSISHSFTTDTPYYWRKLYSISMTSSPFEDVDLNMNGSIQLSISNNETWVFTNSSGYWTLLELGSTIGTTTTTLWQSQKGVGISGDGLKFIIGGNDGWGFWSSSSISSNDGSFMPGSKSFSGTSFISDVSISSDGEMSLLGTPNNGVWSLTGGTFKRIPRTGTGIGKEMVGISFLSSLHNSTFTSLYALPSSPFEPSYLSQDSIIFSTHTFGTNTCTEYTSISSSNDASIWLITCTTGIIISYDSGVTWTLPSNFPFSTLYITGGSLSKESGQYMSIIQGSNLYVSYNFGAQWTKSNEFSNTLSSISMSSDGSMITLLSLENIYQGQCDIILSYKCVFNSFTTEVTSLRYIELDSETEYPIVHNSYQQYISMNGEKKIGIQLTELFLSIGPFESYSSNYSYQIEILDSIAYVSTDYGISFSPVFEVEDPIGAAMSSDGRFCYLITSSDVWKGSLDGPPISSTTTTSSTTSSTGTSTTTSSTGTPTTTSSTGTPTTTSGTGTSTTTSSTGTPTTTSSTGTSTTTSSTGTPTTTSGTGTSTTTSSTGTPTTTSSTGTPTTTSSTGTSTTTSSTGTPTTTSSTGTSTTTSSTGTPTTTSGTGTSTTTSSTGTSTTTSSTGTSTSTLTSCPSTLSSTVISSTTIYYPCHTTLIEVVVVVYVYENVDVTYTSTIFVRPSTLMSLTTSSTSTLTSCPSTLPSTVISSTTIYYPCYSTLVEVVVVVYVYENVDVTYTSTIFVPTSTLT